MPGMLSSIFDPATDETSSEQTETSVAADAGQELSIDEQVGVDVGVTYHDLDGGTHSLQLDNQVGIEADVGASVGAVLGAGEASYTDEA